MKEVKSIQFLSLKAPDKIFGIERALIKLFLVPLMVIFLFLISLGLVIVPKVDSIKENISTISSLNSQINLTEQKKNYLASIDIEQLNQEADVLNRAVLKEKKSYLLVGVVRSIADNFGFQIKSFLVNPGEVKNDSTTTLKVSDKETAVKMPVNVVLAGPSDLNLDLIKALENSLPILFIDKFSSETSNGFSELDMTISSYYVPDKTDYTSGNLSLSDLQLTTEESDLLSEISEFGSNGGISEGVGDTYFIEYNRYNPFSL